MCRENSERALFSFCRNNILRTLSVSYLKVFNNGTDEQYSNIQAIMLSTLNWSFLLENIICLELVAKFIQQLNMIKLSIFRLYILLLKVTFSGAVTLPMQLFFL